MGVFKKILSFVNGTYIPRIFKTYNKMNGQQLKNYGIVQTLATDDLEKKVKLCKDPTALRLAVDLLVAGEVIALPTDTVYGIACNANDCSALKHLYNIKTRDENQPTAICVSDLLQFRKFTISDHLPDDLLNSLLPGPVTIILYKSTYLNSPFLNPGSEKIGVRIPNSIFIRAVAKSCGFSLALTSANLRGEPSTLRIYEFRIIWPKLAAIFDGGNISEDPKSRAASTIIDLSKIGFYQIVRKGIACKETENLLHKHGIEKVDV